MRLKEIKEKTPAELLAFADGLEVENASALKRQDLMFAILKKLAEKEVEIQGEGVLEVEAAERMDVQQYFSAP